MNKTYAGIGSRKTPEEVQKWMTSAAIWLSNADYTLRSGHADGADTAFELGAARKEVYLPWKGFQESTSGLYLDNMCQKEEARKLAKRFHHNFDGLSEGAQKLQTRNSFQILGTSLEEPVDFVLCWTSGGAMVGGTSQALRIAQYYEIPIFNFGTYYTMEDAVRACNVFIVENMKPRCLECSSKGDKRFSAFYASIVHEPTGMLRSIENIYQNAKRASDGSVLGKGEYPDYLQIDGIKYSAEASVPFYNSLWLQYYKDHPEYTVILRNYDTFTDMFRGSSKACQADVAKLVRYRGIEGLQEASDYSIYKIE